jgi:hypothetical protein
MKSNQDNNGGAVLGRSSLVFYLCGVITALCAIWVLIAPWFTAHNLMDFMVERQSCWLAILGVLVFGIAFISFNLGEEERIKRILCWVIFVSSACVTFCGEEFADYTFAYWKVRAIPPAVWAQMASDMRKYGEVAAKNDRPIQPDKLPADLHLLGPIGTLNARWVSSSPGGTNFEVVLECGNRLRAWGMFVSSDKSAQEGLKPICYKTIMVAPDAYFYLRSGGEGKDRNDACQPRHRTCLPLLDPESAGG